jgi:hypothetical protein
MLMLLRIIEYEYNNTKEGAYIPFSLSKAKLSNLDLINLSTCIKSNKCLSYLRTRAYLLKVRYNVQVRSVMNAFIQMAAQQLSKVFQKHMCWRCPAVFLSPRAGSLDEVWMLLHHTPRLKRFHGLLSMSSCTVCPCFCMTASVSQLASSTG